MGTKIPDSPVEMVVQRPKGLVFNGEARDSVDK